MGTGQLAAQLVTCGFPVELVDPVRDMQAVAGSLQRRRILIVTPETVQQYLSAVDRIINAAESISR